MEKYSNIIVGILALLGTLIGSFASGSKTKAIIELRLKALEDKVDKHSESLNTLEKKADRHTQELTNLEEKVDKHNNVVERTYLLEQCSAVIKERLKNMEEDIDTIKNSK